MPVRDTLRPAPEEMFTIRPQPDRLLPGGEGRVHTKVLSRFASHVARQSASDTSSSGSPDLTDDAARAVHEHVERARWPRHEAHHTPRGSR